MHDGLRRAIQDPTHGGWRRALRLLALAARGFVRNKGLHRASELSFDTVLALVPLLALVFATLKGLGVYESFVATTVEPWMRLSFGAHDPADPRGLEPLESAFVTLLDLGERIEIGGLGFVGLVTLLYIVSLLLSTVETSLNEIFGARRGRPAIRKLADYAAILFVLPLCLFLATTFVRAVGVLGWSGGAMKLVVEVGTVGIVSAALTFLYIVMPYTRVHRGSALIGGVVGGVLTYGFFLAHVGFQLGVARYNALYSSFAAVPLFLVWIFVSWLAVLFGASVAAAHEDEAGFRWRIGKVREPFAVRERLALRFAVDATRAYVAGKPAPTIAELAQRAGVPEAFARDVLGTLCAEGVLAAGEARDRIGYIPARDIARLRATHVIEAIRGETHARRPAFDAVDDAVLEVIAVLHGSGEAASKNPTLRELAERAESVASRAAVRGARPGEA